jgi:hypothetical protein
MSDGAFSRSLSLCDVRRLSRSAHRGFSASISRPQLRQPYFSRSGRTSRARMVNISLPPRDRRHLIMEARLRPGPRPARFLISVRLQRGVAVTERHAPARVNLVRSEVGARTVRTDKASLSPDPGDFPAARATMNIAGFAFEQTDHLILMIHPAVAVSALHLHGGVVIMSGAERLKERRNLRRAHRASPPRSRCR